MVTYVPICEYCGQPVDGSEPWGVLFRAYHHRCRRAQPDHVLAAERKRVHELGDQTLAVLRQRSSGDGERGGEVG
jgi:hypothetical protein